ncbi:hypothetical protein ERD78_05985 [Allopusillimonas soli]|uniref:Uncharacterized protein n=1 Tax=Allopusillimonas soli TaxID=659016 RepID=A0A853FEE4_9BURK|nr:hypothetical protein [Allopusillimonas soli]NYT36416.1 hypothetical protein [Allopusillimonas soli]TEA74927.1 hypothetical protein ERD78_05985 [Allopusillimonas soli]
MNLTQGTAERLLENLRGRIVLETEALYSEVEIENAEICRARRSLSATMAGETRCLRIILYNVIKEMARQIA